MSALLPTLSGLLNLAFTPSPWSFLYITRMLVICDPGGGLGRRGGVGGAKWIWDFLRGQFISNWREMEQVQSLNDRVVWRASIPLIPLISHCPIRTLNITMFVTCVPSNKHTQACTYNTLSWNSGFSNCYLNLNLTTSPDHILTTILHVLG